MPPNGVFLLTLICPVRTTSSPPEERPTKRARAASNSNRKHVISGLSKRVRGRLSELPSMPVDIVYEVRDPPVRVKSAKFQGGVTA